MTIGHQWIKRALRSGVRSAFSVLATHYENLAFEMVSNMGFVVGYSDEELEVIRAVTRPAIDILEEKLEEEVLPKEGEN